MAPPRKNAALYDALRDMLEADGSTMGEFVEILDPDGLRSTKTVERSIYRWFNWLRTEGVEVGAFRKDGTVVYKVS